MKKFEIHITGADKGIIEEFENLGIKTLSVELLAPNGSIVGIEHMCSFVTTAENFEEALRKTQNIVNVLHTRILRVKIESPWYEEHVPLALYAEVHMVAPGEKNLLPTVRNQGSDKYVCTLRTFNPKEFLKLREEANSLEKAEFELCLHDTNVELDNIWLQYYAGFSNFRS